MSDDFFDRPSRSVYWECICLTSSPPVRWPKGKERHVLLLVPRLGRFLEIPRASPRFGRRSWNLVARVPMLHLLVVLLEATICVFRACLIKVLEVRIMRGALTLEARFKHCICESDLGSFGADSAKTRFGVYYLNFHLCLGARHYMGACFLAFATRLNDLQTVCNLHV